MMAKSPMPHGTLSSPRKFRTDIKRVAVLFSGGPAPAANAVISTAAAAFLRNGTEVVAILNGYSNLVEYSPNHPLVEGKDFIMIQHRTLKRTRNSRGILIGTARTNPGKYVNKASDISDPDKTIKLKKVYYALCSLDVDALISIGGDDTLKTANMLKLFQDKCNPGPKRIRIVHLPKTIDNDYMGIDFTFGYFTAVDTLSNEIMNLLADAESAQRYFIAETMGRSAGWLAYGAAIAGEASLVIGVEDLSGSYFSRENLIDPDTGESASRPIMNTERIVKRIVATMLAREKENKNFGVIVLAEGLAEYLPNSYLKDIERDDHGHISIAEMNMAKLLCSRVEGEYTRQTGRKRKITSLQLGYETRCARPHAYDVVLGSQIGVGAFRALVEKGLDGVMISASGQLDLNFIPFAKLMDKETLKTVTRFIKPDSDFHYLARFLETYVKDIEDFSLNKTDF
jgi:6-phosphofructokinase 1